MNLFKHRRASYLTIQKMQWLDCQFYFTGQVRPSTYKKWFGVSSATTRYDINVYASHSGKIRWCPGRTKKNVWMAEPDWFPVCGGDKNKIWKAFRVLKGIDGDRAIATWRRDADDVGRFLAKGKREGEGTRKAREGVSV